MTTEDRKLNIQARMRDFASASLRKLGKTITGTFTLGRKSVEGFRKSVTSIQGLLGGALLVSAARRGAGIFSEMAEGLDQVNAQATATNTTASSLLLLRNNAAEAGINFDQLAAAMRTFEKNIGDARQGAESQASVLRRLGLTVDDFTGANKDAVDELATVADALQTIEDASTRSNLALKLFGEDTGAALLPILSRGGSALRQYAEAQRASGQALTNEDIQRATDYRVNVERLSNTLQSLAERIFVDVAPALTQFFDDIKRLVEENAPAVREGMVSILLTMASGVEVFTDLAFVVRKSALGWDLLAKTLSRGYLELTGTNEEIEQAKRRQYEAADAVRENDRAHDELNSRFEDLRETIKRLKKEQDDYRRGLVADQSQPDPIAVSVTATAPTELEKFWDGFDERTDQAIEKWQDWRKAGIDASQSLVDNGLSRLGDAFGDWIAGVKQGKEVWREFAIQLLRDLARVIGRLITVKIVSSIFGSAASGGGSGGGSSTGGTALGAQLGTSSSTLALQAPRSTLAATIGGGEVATPVVNVAGGGGPTVNFTIQAWDGRDAARALFNQRGQIRAMFQSDVSRVRAVRQNIRSAVS